MDTRDFESEIGNLENIHRHDLAVHLYLAHLLHRVNPLFPAEKWASWPQKIATDPTVYEDYTDSIIGPQNDFVTISVNEDLPVSDNQATLNIDSNDSGVDSDYKTVFFRSGSVKLNKLQRLKSHPKALLVNEMHALLQRRIRRRFALSNPKKLSSVIDAELPLLRDMALQMANRMGRTIARLKQQRLLSKISAEDKPFLDSHVYRKYYKQNWQDVVTADLRSCSRAKRVELRRLRELYTKCRRLFHEESYKYEYDAADYDGDSVPEFDAEEHLAAIQADPAYNISPLDPTQLLQDAKKVQAYKENFFIKLWDLAAMGQQFSYIRKDHPGHCEQDHLAFEDDEKLQVLWRNGLAEDDFTLDFNV